MVKSKDYGMFRFVDENGKEQFRKPSIKQRKQIFAYYIRRRSGRIMKIHEIAKVFNVSDRIIQKLLKELEVEGIIRREPVYDEKGFQKANRIIYTGEKKRLTGNEPSIDKVYDKDNPLKLWDFE
jgi:predicted DNA-binding transcriptional regulator